MHAPEGHTLDSHSHSTLHIALPAPIPMPAPAPALRCVAITSPPADILVLLTPLRRFQILPDIASLQPCPCFPLSCPTKLYLAAPCHPLDTATLSLLSFGSPLKTMPWFRSAEKYSRVHAVSSRTSHTSCGERIRNRIMSQPRAQQGHKGVYCIVLR